MLPQTPRELAKFLIRDSVLRGDTLTQIKRTQMGSSGPGYWVELRGDHIDVLECGPMPPGHVRSSLQPIERYTLRSIYNELLRERMQPSLFD